MVKEERCTNFSPLAPLCFSVYFSALLWAPKELAWRLLIGCLPMGGASRRSKGVSKKERPYSGPLDPTSPWVCGLGDGLWPTLPLATQVMPLLNQILVPGSPVLDHVPMVPAGDGPDSPSVTSGTTSQNLHLPLWLPLRMLLGWPDPACSPTEHAPISSRGQELFPKSLLPLKDQSLPLTRFSAQSEDHWQDCQN